MKLNNNVNFGTKVQWDGKKLNSKFDYDFDKGVWRAKVNLNPDKNDGETLKINYIDEFTIRKDDEVKGFEPAKLSFTLDKEGNSKTLHMKASDFKHYNPLLLRDKIVEVYDTLVYLLNNDD